MSDVATLLGLLADERRRKVVAAVELGATTRAEIAAATGLDARSVATALHRLSSGGLVVDDAGRWSVRQGAFSEAAREAAAARRPGDDAGVEPDDRVLRTFFRHGRLTQIPAARAKRRVVLDFLASQFEPGRVYPERDVNFMLQRFHPDYAALRRHLVDGEFLERREGFYWRAGGTFDVE